MAITTTLSPYVGDLPLYGVQAQATFVARAEYSWTWMATNIITEMNQIITQANDLETNVNAKEVTASAAASTATTQAGIATTQAGLADTARIAAELAEVNAELAESNTTTLMNQFENNVYVRSPNPPASYEAAWFDTTNNSLKIWNSVAWVSAGTVVNGMYARNTYTATTGQDVFNSVYDVNSIMVYRNGIMLPTSDFTATNGTSITLAVGATAGDIIDIIGIGAINSDNIYDKTEVNSLLSTKADSSTIVTLSQIQATALCF